ncbi:hypothetical protein QYF61_013534 [Mycteria americana]|uniref:BET1-like protein n=1 Tax=Mycteria americana TaxID=33587 RepID=A0AAN7N5Q2_MYCAM|nr:hypothetical protein QYF61_013534 [Mycteria americana]
MAQTPRGRRCEEAAVTAFVASRRPVGQQARSASPATLGQSPGAVEDMLDVENKRMADSLANKVTRLKSLALDIDKDADEQNRYLDGMDSDFMSVTGLLTGSVKRFSTMTRSGRDNRKLLCSVSAGLIVVFFILYYLLCTGLSRLQLTGDGIGGPREAAGAWGLIRVTPGKGKSEEKPHKR